MQRTEEVADDHGRVLQREAVRLLSERRPFDRTQEERLRFVRWRLQVCDGRQLVVCRQHLYDSSRPVNVIYRGRGHSRKKERRQTLKALSRDLSAVTFATFSTSNPCSLALASACRRSVKSAASIRETRKSAYLSTAFVLSAPAYRAISSLCPAS